MKKDQIEKTIEAIDKTMHELLGAIRHPLKKGEHLKNYPFCDYGGDDWLSLCERDPDNWFVFCRQCCCEGPGGIDRDNGIGMWNERGGHEKD
jgi:hypothetical protein